MNKIECATHGESNEAFVCRHLIGESTGQGFNRNEPTAEDPFPDAWCDDCEVIRAAHDGWNEQSEKLCKITLLCSECYERSRILNTVTSSLDDLKDLRWKCGDCDEWHFGPCLDFAYSEPYYWSPDNAAAEKKDRLRPRWSREDAATFLDEDYCAIDATDFFIRGVIHLPIIGCGETLRFGVWGSVSRENFLKLLEADNSEEETDFPPVFSWLSTSLPEYPETLNLKMQAYVQEPGTRPFFRVEPSDHPLAQEYHRGITPERVKEIMLQRLSGNE